MTVDLKKIKEKLDKLQNPGSGRKTWRPSLDKDNKIRILENPHSDDPFPEIYFHYLGRNSVMCLYRTHGEECPICDFVRELWDSEDKVDVDMAKKLSARRRSFAPVVDRSDPTLTPKWWGFGSTVYEKLLGYCLNEQYEGYLDTKKGLDATVELKQIKGKKYPDTDVILDRKETPLADSAKEIKEILGNVVPLEQVYEKPDISEVVKKFQSWIKKKEANEPWDDSGKDDSKTEETRGSKDDDDTGYDDVAEAFRTAADKE